MRSGTQGDHRQAVMTRKTVMTVKPSSIKVRWCMCFLASRAIRLQRNACGCKNQLDTRDSRVAQFLEMPRSYRDGDATNVPVNKLILVPL